MVRSRELLHRTRLLNIIQRGEQPCRRLFLDYRGLRLLWSYMRDIAGDLSENAQRYRLEILKTLYSLPIPNKTMVVDSKVFSEVDKWSKKFYEAQRDSPEDEQLKPKLSDSSLKNLNVSKEEKLKEKIASSRVKMEINTEEGFDESLVSQMASEILSMWSDLKEVFRIPKKERIEQMKEHEREAGM